MAELRTVMTCSKTANSNVLYVGTGQAVKCVMPDGTVGFPVMVTAYLSDQPSPFEMTAEDGAVASGLIVSCWVTAFAVRSVISIFRGSKNDA